jgi:hypothetical protein
MPALGRYSVAQRRPVAGHTMAERQRDVAALAVGNGGFDFATSPTPSPRRCLGW